MDYELILNSLNYRINESSDEKFVATKYVGHGMFVVEIINDYKKITFLMPSAKDYPVVWASANLCDLSEIPTKENEVFHKTYNWPPLCRKG